MELESVLGSDRLEAWEQLSTPMQRWLRRGIKPDIGPDIDLNTLKTKAPAGVITPHSREELAQLMTVAAREKWRVMPMGSGTKLGWGQGRSPIDVVVKCDRLQQVVERDPGDLTISVEAGMTLGVLQRELASHNQFLPLDPNYPEQATMGGIVATADSGSLRQGFGGVRDMLLGIEFVRPDGERSQAGGKVVKNVAGYDLMKLFTGAYGTLGIISRLTWRVYPIPDCWQSLVITGDRDALAQLTQQVLGSPLTPVAWDWNQCGNQCGNQFSTAEVSGLDKLEGLVQDFPPNAPWLAGRFASVTASTNAQVKWVTEQAIALGLTVQVLRGSEDQQLWRELRTAIAPPVTPETLENQEDSIQGKLAVIADQVPTLLKTVQDKLPGAIVQIRGGSGLGKIYCPPATVTESCVEGLKHLRHTCETHRGFLSILNAPSRLKSQLDPWGYLGQGQPMAIALRDRFDPHRLINPNCFIV